MAEPMDRTRSLPRQFLSGPTHHSVTKALPHRAKALPYAQERENVATRRDTDLLPYLLRVGTSLTFIDKLYSHVYAGAYNEGEA